MTDDDGLPRDAPDDRLALATEENLFALFEAMAARLPGGELRRAGALAAHHTAPTNPMFKGAWGARLAPGDVDAAIDETVAWFRARDAPYFFWWTGPGGAPADLGERLRAKGFLDMAEQQETIATGVHHGARGAPVMVASLAAMDGSALARTPPGFRVVEASDAAALEDFARVFVASYGIPDWAGAAWVDATLAVGVDRAPWRVFVGYLDGAAVATCILFVGGGVASVYGVATLPALRGKGIGAAITLAPLRAARDAGCRHAGLFSTEMGLPVYARLGFRDTGARINRYLWRAP